jgi:hypothetical protein
MQIILRNRQEIGQRIRAYLAEDGVLYLGVAAFVVCGLAYLFLSRKFHWHDVSATFLDYSAVWIAENGIIYPLALLALGYIRITLRLDSRRRLAYLHMFSSKRISRFVSGTLLMLAFVLFRSMFGSIKNVIAEGQGFAYDKIFADLDQALHFGRAPWEWMYSIAQHPWVLRFVEFNYETIWFIICFGAQYWVAVATACDKIRLRYMLTFMLSWIVVGDVFATWFSSAGPVFYHYITGDAGRFGPLVDFVHAAGGATFGSAAHFQDYLWCLYSNDIPGLGSGISAFPSMHVAIIVLNGLFLYESNRKWAVPVVLYVAFIIMSSTYLGWHYAVDGYAAAILTTAIYLAVNKVTSVRWKLWPGRASARAEDGAVTAD